MNYDELLNKYNTLLKAYAELEYENKVLKERFGVPVVKEKAEIGEDATSRINKYSPKEEKLQLYMSLFKGREDVYAKRWESREGKKGYTPVCVNEWKPGLCNKKLIKCDKCKHRRLVTLDNKAIEKHLRGIDELGRDVIGLYPLLEDDTCYLLAVDFDKKEWKKDVSAFRLACEEQGLEVAVEKSRSGNGAHVWVFFDTNIPAITARRLGNLLLTNAMNKRHEIGFESYDRLFPNQDTMPKGGFGNLIALPLQGNARKNDNSVFVDCNFILYEDQWKYLSQLKKLSTQEVEKHIKQLEKLVGTMAESEISTEKNQDEWKTLKTIKLEVNDFPHEVKVLKSHMLYIDKEGISARALNQFKRIASFNNPDFFKTQAMRMPTYDKPRVIYGFEETEDALILPRGCEENLLDILAHQNIKVRVQEDRNSGCSIDVTFNGILRDEQIPAAEEMSKHENGVLAATTAFGKTVIGAHLIATRKVNTLILVHNKQLLGQWKERLEKFLIINEEVPEKLDGKRKRKVKRIIGEIGGGKNRAHGIVDVAIIQSMIKKEEMKELIKIYGMIIVDECHHLSAFSFEQVIKRAMAKYVYGLTATPTRQDDHHPIIFMQCGPIRYRVDAKKQAEERPFDHYLIPRFTSFKMDSGLMGERYGINTIYKALCESRLRNSLILGDIVQALEKGRTPIVISERTEHVQYLAEKLKARCKNVIVLTGGLKARERKEMSDKLQSIPADEELVLVATGKYIGEGFDFPRLDTLFLAMPIAWKGTLAQYAGRLHRNYETKEDVLVYDYVEIHVDTLEKMYHKRVKGYASIGYAVWNYKANRNSQNIYESVSFTETFLKDINEADKSIVIVSPSLSRTRTMMVKKHLESKSMAGIKVQIITKPIEQYNEKSKGIVIKIVNELVQLGCEVNFKEDVYQKS